MKEKLHEKCTHKKRQKVSTATDEIMNKESLSLASYDIPCLFSDIRTAL